MGRDFLKNKGRKGVRPPVAGSRLKASTPSACLGFTLIELLVVIAIIAILSTLSLGGYTSYRRSTLLKFSAENILSQISQIRSKAFYGDIKSGKKEDIKKALESGESGNIKDPLAVLSDAKCYGIYFEKGADGNFYAYSFSQKFEGRKVWKGDLKGWEYEGCGSFDSNSQDSVQDKLPIELDAMAKIQNISEGNGLFVMRFVPPYGNVEVSTGGDFTGDFSSSSAAKDVRIQIKYGDDENPDYKKNIDFDFVQTNGIIAD